MDEAAYQQHVVAAFRKILKAADAFDPDILESDSTGDMLTLTAPQGEKCVVNTQRAVHQIWVAGKGAGIHFSLDAGGLWKDDKGKGLELLAWVSEVVASMTGQPLNY
ncbi:MAG: iron donor protein CyaY [Myxococcaceae bacterium]